MNRFEGLYPRTVALSLLLSLGAACSSGNNVGSEAVTNVGLLPGCIYDSGATISSVQLPEGSYPYRLGTVDKLGEFVRVLSFAVGPEADAIALPDKTTGVYIIGAHGTRAFVRTGDKKLELEIAGHYPQVKGTPEEFPPCQVR